MKLPVWAKALVVLNSVGSAGAITFWIIVAYHYFHHA